MTFPWASCCIEMLSLFSLEGQGGSILPGLPLFLWVWHPPRAHLDSQKAKVGPGEEMPFPPQPSRPCLLRQPMHEDRDGGHQVAGLHGFVRVVAAVTVPDEQHAGRHA